MNWKNSANTSEELVAVCSENEKLKVEIEDLKQIYYSSYLSLSIWRNVNILCVQLAFASSDLTETL